MGCVVMFGCKAFLWIRARFAAGTGEGVTGPPAPRVGAGARITPMRPWGRRAHTVTTPKGAVLP